MRVAFVVIVIFTVITAASQGSNVVGDRPARRAEPAPVPGHADFQRNARALLASQRPELAPTPGALVLGGLGMVIAYRPAARRKRTGTTVPLERVRVAAA